MAREMPPTRKTEIFKKLLGVLWVASIVGITLSASALVDTLANASSLDPPDLVWRRSLKDIMIICECGIIAWAAHRGTTRNLAPPEWLVLLVSVLACAVAFL